MPVSESLPVRVRPLLPKEWLLPTCKGKVPLHLELRVDALNSKSSEENGSVLTWVTTNQQSRLVLNSPPCLSRAGA